MLVNHSENRENILVDNKTKFGRTIRAYHRLATVKKIAKYEDEKERPRARKIVRRGEYKNKRRHLRKKRKAAMEMRKLSESNPEYERLH